MQCRRCDTPHDPTRMFCPGCGKLQDRRLLTVRISTEESRGRALTEVDRAVGLYDSDALAERKNAEFFSA